MTHLADSKLRQTSGDRWNRTMGEMRGSDHNFWSYKCPGGSRFGAFRRVDWKPDVLRYLLPFSTGFKGSKITDLREDCCQDNVRLEQKTDGASSHN